MKIRKVSAGRNHVLALTQGATGTLYTWGKGSSGQLGHGDYFDQRFPKRNTNIVHGIKDMLAVGHTSVVVDELNTLSAFGCNRYGALGDGSTDPIRSEPGKFAREIIIDPVVALRGNYEEPPNEDEYGRSTLSFKTEPGDIYVWGCFQIPPNGSEPTDQSDAKKKKPKKNLRYMKTPERLNFMFARSLRIDIKDYQIDRE